MEKKQEKQEIKYITPKEFRDLGYLQELNRIFLHPLGMALSIRICRDHKAWDDGTVPDHTPENCPIPDGQLNKIYDYRDDPEGMAFDPEDIKANQKDYIDKATYVAKQWKKLRPARLAAGFIKIIRIDDVQSHVYLNLIAGKDLT